jgi:hypothetical protein
MHLQYIDNNPTNHMVMRLTLAVSLIEPRPRIKTRQPVVASTRLSEFPRGPKILPTKLNCRIHELLTLVSDQGRAQLVGGLNY